MSQTFAHDSILGGLNLVKRFDNRFFIEAAERPPYPIIINKPYLTDVVANLNLADFGVFLAFTIIGINNKEVIY